MSDRSDAACSEFDVTVGKENFDDSCVSRTERR